MRFDIFAAEGITQLCDVAWSSSPETSTENLFLSAA